MEEAGEYYRDVWAEINLDAIGKNIQTFRKHIPAETKIMAVVKADGYGHGAYRVAQKALSEGAEWLGVALLDEALELRSQGITAPILVLSSFPARGIEIAIRHDIVMTVYQQDMAKEICRKAEELQKVAKIHMKVDTGMGRIGMCTAEELRAFLDCVETCPWIEIEGMFTHFATADEEDTAYTLEQYRMFEKLIDELKARGITIPLLYTNNSAAAMFYPEKSRHMIRLGISLYGQYPSDYAKTTNIPLMPAFSWKARISHVKRVPKGAKVSYGATYEALQEAVIATIPVGYADGYNRLLSNKGYVLIKGERAPIAGRVCMDQFMVDVTHIPDIAVGEEVVLIGKQGNDEISVDEMAKWLTTINYEVTCMVSKRVPRVYMENGRIVSVSNRISTSFCQE
ncbi:alanine racemase [Aneurinibacillus aneurinilyticus]|jgi:alanine racemase|uniref:Alanine racemase n=2 Tax=Aneurinibacillus aneurinilyticus TaxID=1391 RepID=A0A848D5M3_ANEAE|nr:alanine racemase [Aneurinibacillus aneurinilyticus]ERI11730.1 alanine racemase [Aneurinibacillus aneurinilyticus ATCC 12856]MCI1696580.1 alanine racemase [Aneurinibacillus aneurinilyticus]MED0669384.1 alanine racemase [Aneurinibacillus aneurinilyticus]MED0705322.1 alanine racemase [Aneurinibacillus aneurinilyticus]MED0725901.1 alanine racemase [Aneurinibacillus aneurinilyticus]